MDAERFPFRRLGESMRSGVEPVEMLVDGWLPRRATVWLASEPEAGKTWICLWLAARAMESGHRVAYIDAELGESEIVRRLLLLGVDPAVVDERMDYLPFPSWTLEDKAGWEDACAEAQWDLVVFETASDFLSDAGLSENDGLDVTDWAKAFPERVRIHGGTALVSDHVRKDGVTNGYAVGSRSKKAKSQLGYEVNVASAYDAEHAGSITVTRTKNTFSAPVPKKRTLDLGPIHGPGTFDIRDASASAEQSSQEPTVVMADVLCAALYDGGHVNEQSAISQNTLTKLVAGNQKLKADAAQHAASSPFWPVHSFAYGANSIRYYATGRARTAPISSSQPIPIPSNSEPIPELVGTNTAQPIPDGPTRSGIGIAWSGHVQSEAER